jgi:Zn-dependent peptidase ImmA (M78 family)
MNKGPIFANRIREEFDLNDKIDFQLIEEISFYKDAYVDYKPIEGAQGRIIFKEKSTKSFITINSAINYGPKKKFVLAHELGHALIHREGNQIFVCDEQDLNRWDIDSNLEAEANSFAAELIVPEKKFKELSKGEFSSEQIRDLSNHFGFSLTAMSIRYTKIGLEKCYSVYSTNGVIKWISWTDDFYLGQIHRGSRIPKGTNTHRYYNKGVKKGKEVVLAKTWFSECHKQDIYLYEDCIYLDQYNSAITLLWVCKDFNL